MLCNVHVDSMVGMYREMYTDNTGAMAYHKDCTKLLQQPTVSPCDRFTTGCMHTLKCCFGVKHGTHHQICEVERKLCQFAGPTHTTADGHPYNQGCNKLGHSRVAPWHFFKKLA